MTAREHTCERVMAARDDAERFAWASLGNANFVMFGHWAQTWTVLNGRLSPGMARRDNPFAGLVKAARERVA